MSDTVGLVLTVYHTQEDDPQKEISCTLEYGYDKQSSRGEIEHAESVKSKFIICCLTHVNVWSHGQYGCAPACSLLLLQVTRESVSASTAFNLSSFLM